MAAVIKRTASFFILKETNGKPNHIDNYVDLADFITNEVDNCTGIVVKMSTQDKEYEVKKIKDILSFFQIIFQQEKNVCYARKKECFCQFCTSKNFNKCTNNYTGNLLKISMEMTGEKEATGYETLKVGIDEAKGGEQFLVEKIVGKRIHKVIIIKRSTLFNQL